MKVKTIKLLPFLLVILLVSSCIQTPEPKTPKRIGFLLNVGNVGSTFEVGPDSAHITEIKFFVDRINLSLPDGATLQTAINGLIMNYLNTYNGQDETVLAANIGYEDVDQFQEIELSVAPPEDGGTFQDEEFFGEETNYSLIIKGTYNDKTFTYMTSLSFDKTFPFGETVTLNQSEETLIIKTTYDVRALLTNPSGDGLLDPTQEENEAVINSNFETLLDIEASAADLY